MSDLGKMLVGFGVLLVIVGVILMLADGHSYSTIEAASPCYRDYINRWRRRFLVSRLEGLRPR